MTTLFIKKFKIRRECIKKSPYIYNFNDNYLRIGVYSVLIFNISIRVYINKILIIK